MSSPKEVKDTFEKYANDFDQWFLKNKEIYLSELNAIMACDPEGRILDLGVGSGVFSSKMKVDLGVDISERMLALSQKRGMEVVLADVRDLPIRAQAFDTIVSSFTTCFVDDVYRMFKETRRVLRPEGRFILGEITIDSAWGKNYLRAGMNGHRFYSKARFFSLRDSLRLLSEVGFNPDLAIGTLSFSPNEKARIERPVKLDFGNTDSFARFGFICISATRKNSRA